MALLREIGGSDLKRCVRLAGSGQRGCPNRLHARPRHDWSDCEGQAAGCEGERFGRAGQGRAGQGAAAAAPSPRARTGRERERGRDHPLRGDTYRGRSDQLHQRLAVIICAGTCSVVRAVPHDGVERGILMRTWLLARSRLTVAATDRRSMALRGRAIGVPRPRLGWPWLTPPPEGPGACGLPTPLKRSPEHQSEELRRL